MSTPYYLDDYALKTWPTDLKYEEKIEQDPRPSNSQILKNLFSGKLNWLEARKEFDFLSTCIDQESVTLWKLINDGAELQELDIIRNIMHKDEKTEKDLNILKSRFDAIEEIEPDDEEEQVEYRINWIDIYRKTYKRLDKIFNTYTTDPLYMKKDKIFDISKIAQDLKNEFLLEQTRPISEAHIHLDIDEYTGIHQDHEEDYLKVPDHVTLEDHHGKLQTVALTELKDMGSWAGEIDEPIDYDEDAEGELPSQSMRQWENAELHVTSEYYTLSNKYFPMILEIARRIEDHPIVKEAKQDEKDQAREEAALSLKNTRLARWFKQALKNEYRQGMPPQDIAALMLVDIPIPLEVNGNLSTIIDQFSDDILDSMVEPAGLVERPDCYWESALEEFHNQTIELLEEKGVEHTPKWSSHFTVSAFKSIVEDHLTPGKAIAHAYDDFRSAISPAAANAFRQTIEDGGSNKEAMAKFYQVAKQEDDYVPRDRIIRANDNEVTLLTASSGYKKTREINWQLFHHKAVEGEVFIPKDAKDSSKIWLFNKLKSLYWSDKLISKLAE